MCNLYSMTKNVDAIKQLFGALNSRVGNLPSLPGIFPDYPAPIVRNALHGREIIEGVKDVWMVGRPGGAKAGNDKRGREENRAHHALPFVLPAPHRTKGHVSARYTQP